MPRSTVGPMSSAGGRCTSLATSCSPCPGLANLARDFITLARTASVSGNSNGLSVSNLLLTSLYSALISALFLAMASSSPGRAASPTSARLVAPCRSSLEISPTCSPAASTDLPICSVMPGPTNGRLSAARVVARMIGLGDTIPAGRLSPAPCAACAACTLSGSSPATLGLAIAPNAPRPAVMPGSAGLKIIAISAERWMASCDSGSTLPASTSPGSVTAL